MDIALPGMPARDVAWNAYAARLTEVGWRLAHELGATILASDLRRLVNRAPLGWEGVLFLVEQLDTHRLLAEAEFRTEVLSGVDREGLDRAAKLVEDWGKPDLTELTPDVLVGTWRAFASSGYLIGQTDIEDGFCHTLKIDADGSFELTMDHDPFVFCRTGNWRIAPTFELKGKTRGWTIDEDAGEVRVPYEAVLKPDWFSSIPAMTLFLEDVGCIAFARDERVRSLRALAP
ncbi:MAG: hypothetical protein AAGF12_00895 [Myxococcota bacterium]